MYSRGRKEGERSRERVQRNNSWELPKPGEEPDLQVHEAKIMPNNINAKRPSPKHITLNWQKPMTKKKYQGKQDRRK